MPVDNCAIDPVTCKKTGGTTVKTKKSTKTTVKKVSKKPTTGKCTGSKCKIQSGGCGCDK
jgi:hypothetical protein